MPVSRPAAAETAAGNGHTSQPPAAGSAPFLPFCGSLPAPVRTVAAATSPGAAAPLSTSQQHRLLMDFLADQEARCDHRLTELQRQQTAFIQQQNAARWQQAQPLPSDVPAPRRRVLPVASPFTRQEPGLAAGPAVVTEDRLQQRERRQVLTLTSLLCLWPVLRTARAMDLA